MKPLTRCTEESKEISRASCVSQQRSHEEKEWDTETRLYGDHLQSHMNYLSTVDNIYILIDPLKSSRKHISNSLHLAKRSFFLGHRYHGSTIPVELLLLLWRRRELLWKWR